MCLAIALGVVLGCAEASRPLPDMNAVDTRSTDTSQRNDVAVDTRPGDMSESDTSSLPSHCSDGIRSGTETGVDCGGPDCLLRCAAGDGCDVPNDCASGRCVASVCEGVGCELDVDCPSGLPYCVAGSCEACTTAAHCDDGEPCTDDSCTGGQCLNAPRTGTCDDGFYCNGVEQCESGECVPSTTTPCSANRPCNENTKSCDECATDLDCGTVTRTAWSQCTGFDGQCDETGMRFRQVTTPRCTAGTCTRDTETESEVCTRATENRPCGTQTAGEWDVSCDSACGSVTRRRTLVTPTCIGGTCVDVEDVETDTCDGLPNGSRCQDDGTYCGQTLKCHECRSGNCSVNTPHYDASCLPSCGTASNLCNVTGVCCQASAACSRGEVGPTWDCEKCCVDTCN